jgi:hypothetical protein
LTIKDKFLARKTEEKEKKKKKKNKNKKSKTVSNVTESTDPSAAPKAHVEANTKKQHKKKNPDMKEKAM